MENSEKAKIYGQLLNEHTRVGNQISEIKSENFEMNDEQLKRIKVLENRLVHIMKTIKTLMS